VKIMPCIEIANLASGLIDQGDCAILGSLV
jgi:hypothetical protein